MIESFNALPANFDLDADICIIGAGAAGILIAREFLNTRHQVVVLESGGLTAETPLQALYEGEIDHQPFRGLTAGRSRVFGGTTTLWGGQCIPLDPIDFEYRAWVPDSGWPISAETLAPYYARARRHFDISNDDCDRSVWDRFGLDPIDYHPNLLKAIHGVFMRKPDLGQRFHKELARAPNIRVLLYANVVRLRTDASGTRIHGADLRSLAGKTGKVKAPLFVLCAGGIENARLLLLSDTQNPKGLGNNNDLVGRYFQDHPCGRCALIETENPLMLQNHYNLLYGRTVKYLPKIALSEYMQRKKRTLNCAGRVEYEFSPDSGIQVIKDILVAARARRLPDAMVWKAIRLGRESPHLAHSIWRVFGRGLSPAPKPSRIYLEAFSEQAPERSSRVTLSDAKDALGLRKIRVEWRVNELTRHTIATFAHSARTEFSRLGLGELKVHDWLDAPEPAETHFTDIYHHAGTTRMAKTAMQGVVDSKCEVFGIYGLFIAGSSVFPTSGAANPTLTIAAISLRIADRLKSELGQLSWHYDMDIPADYQRKIHRMAI